jgi:hemolysin D
MTALAGHWGVFRDAWAAETRRAKAHIRVVEPDFLPAALEIIERPVSPTARVTALVLLGGLVVTIGWLFIGQVDIVASADGRIIPADNVKLVQPSEAGIVRAIHVHEGSRVKRGDLLVELDPTVSGSEQAEAAKQLMSAELEVASNTALLSALNGHGVDFHPPDGTPNVVVETQRALIAAQLQEISARAAGLNDSRSSALADESSAEREVAKLDESLPLVDQQLNAYKSLLVKGFAPKLKVIELERQRLVQVKDREIAVQHQRRAKSEIARTVQALTQARQEARRSILANLVRAETEASVRRQELVKAKAKTGRQLLTAPTDGTIHQLQVHTLGGVVEVIKSIMTIVPAGGTLVVEAKLLNKDAGFVHAGQPVSVKLEAFPFTRYGAVPGIVESVSSDAVADDHLGLIYIARIALQRSEIDAGGQRTPLTAGMQTTADIRTGRRRLIDYLVSPIAATTKVAGREQ